MAKAKKSETTLTLEEKLEHALVADEEQPYKVPDNWCWTTLGMLCKFINGYAFKSNNFSDVTGVPVIRITNISDGHVDIENCIFTTETDIDEKFIVNNGDLLIAMSGATTGKNGVYKNDVKVFLNQRVGNIKVKYKNILKQEFRNYYISCIQETILDSAYGGAQPNISASKICQLLIPLPPFSEQQRIVNRIERLFSKLDEVKENAQNVIDGFEDRKSAILHKAFNGELTAKWREENKVNITEWNLLTLNDVGEYKKGPFGSSITKAMFVPKSQNTYKVYEQGNAIRKTLEYGRYYISKEKYEELKGFSVKGGDIIISCAGTIGEVYKLPDNCEAGIINQALMRVRLFENIEEDFFMYYFGEILKEDINNKSKGTAIKNIPPFKVMKAISIQLPSLPEQREIVHTLNRILFKEQQAKEKAEEVLEKIELIKKSILARAFRGELGTNDPDEESSLELLKMVLSEDKDENINSKSKSK